MVVSAGEHSAVLKAAEATGVPVTTVGLDENGVIRVDQIAEAIEAADAVGEQILVAVHAVNNETGVVQPMARIEAMVGSTPHYLFVDAVQALGKLPLEFASRAPDMMAVSAHKIGGPAGVGALLVKGHADAARLIPGGGQESGRRGGTESAALIAAFRRGRGGVSAALRRGDGHRAGADAGGRASSPSRRPIRRCSARWRSGSATSSISPCRG